jgi:DnaJ homolog subfamily C member 19
MKLLLLALLALLALRLLLGRWPVLSSGLARARRISDARALLGLGGGASRAEIIAAHRRLLIRVHPDHGGSGEAVQAADAARNLLLARLADRPPTQE